MNSYIVRNFYYDLVSSSDHFSICHCSSSSLSEYEPQPINDRFVWESKPGIFSRFHSEMETPISNLENSSKNLTGAFMTGAMFSFKQKLEPRVATTDLTLSNGIIENNNDFEGVGTFICSKQNLNWTNHPDQSESHSGKEDVTQCKDVTSSVSLSLHSLRSASHSDQTIGRSSKSCNTTPTNKSKMKHCKNGKDYTILKRQCCVPRKNGPCIQKPSVKRKQYFSMTQTQIPEKINIMSGKKLNKPGSRKGACFTYVKPPNALEKERNVNKLHKCTRKNVSSKVKDLQKSPQSISKREERTLNHNFNKKKVKTTLRISSEASNKFEDNSISCLTINGAKNIAKLDINLKDSEQLITVAKVIIEALKRNATNSDDINIKVLSSCLSFPIETKIFQQKSQINRKKKVRKQTVTCNSVQFFLDRVSSVFEKERLNLNAKVNDGNCQPIKYCARKVEEEQCSCSDDDSLFKKFERQIENEIANLKRKNP